MSTLEIQVLYLKPPCNFVPTMEVVACFIKHENKILLLERSSSKPEGGTWCVPGGKREQHETLSAAMSREVCEETGLIIPESSLKYSKTTYVRYPKFDFIYHLFQFDFKQTPPAIQINIDEHQTYHWTTLLEAHQLSLTPGIDEAFSILYE